MVEPSFVDLKSLSDEIRFRIFDYLWASVDTGKYYEVAIEDFRISHEG